MWISTQQVNYWSYILHSSGTWEDMGIQWSKASAIYNFKKADGSVRREVLYNILIEFGNPHETGKTNKKICVNDTYSGILVGKHLSDVFIINTLRTGDADLRF